MLDRGSLNTEAAPFVSIIIATYNRAYCLNRAISSVLCQSFEDLEVIVVDDGSTDETSLKLGKITDPRVKICRHGENRGVTAAKNTGLNNACGEWVGILDSDDEMLPGVLETLVKRINAIGTNNRLGTIIGNCVKSTDGSFTGNGVVKDGFVSYQDFLSGRVSGEFWGLFSRSVLATSRFDEALPGFESVLWLEMYKRSSTYYIHFPARIFHIGNPDQVSHFASFMSRAPKMVKGYACLLERHGEDFLKHCPQRYGYYLRRQALFEKLSHQNGAAVKHMATALRWSLRDLKEWFMFFCACLAPFTFTTKAAELIYKRTRS